MKNLLTFGIGATPTQSTVTWGQPAQQCSVMNGLNPLYPRVIILTDIGLRIQRGTTAAAIQTADLIAALVTLEPTLSWPPIITVQPVADSVAAGAAASFSVTATCESCLTLSYQWQVSTNGGSTYSNLTNAGVYTNVTTATMNISASTGLNGNLYRCNVTNASGTTATVGALLSCPPVISAQPNNASVTHPASASFSITASADTTGYQWQLSTDGGSTWNNVVNGSPYSGATTATLTINPTATSENGYKYRCIASDSAGSTTSNSATLTVS